MSVDNVVDRTALAALNPPTGGAAFLMEAGREGIFEYRSGNFSAQVAIDTLEGIYVPSTVSGFPVTSGCWVRVWDQSNCRPEWFGATVNDPLSDNTQAIQTILNLGFNVRLSPGQYYIGNGAAGVGSVLLTISKSGQSIMGAGASKISAPNCSELVIRSAAASGILVGFATNPGGSGTNNWLFDATLKDFSIRRDVARYPLANPASGTTNAPCGFKLQWAAVCMIENVYTFEHSFGSYITATVACKLIEVRHERFTSGTSPANDFFVGNQQDNSTASPFNSGNASLYYTGGGAFSNEAAGNSYTYNAGIQSYQGFTDTYVVGFETGNCGYGVDFGGRQSTAADYQTEDLLVSECVFDGCRWDAIRVQVGGPTTAVQITDNYCGVSNATGPISNAIHLQNIHGSANVANNQCIGNAGNPARGLYMDTSSGITARGNIYTDLSNPVVISATVLFRCEDHVNVSVVAPSVAAVQVIGSTRGVIECEIASSVGAISIPVGVDLVSTGNSLIEVRCTNIHSPSLAGGSANKLVNNGTQITTSGAFGSNCLAQGIMA